MELYKVKDLVMKCLEKDTGARNSDWKLYEDVCKMIGLDTSTMTLHDMVQNTKHIPSFESVSRTRRKIQADGEYPATEGVRYERALNEKKYIKEFA